MEANGIKFYPDAQYTKFVRSSQDPPPYYKKTLLGPENTMTVCQFCNATVTTTVKYTATTRTHLVAAAFGMICCCCIPYLLTSSKNSDHYCPNCDRYLGTYQK